MTDADTPEGDDAEAAGPAEAVAVRRVDPERFREFRHLVDYAFDPTEGPQAYDEQPERIAERYGAFVDDELVSICADYDFTVRLRGEWAPLAGLAAVATPPEHRRRGYVACLIDAALQRWRGEYPLAALWPFDHPYYAQFGWATANKRARYSCSPEALAFARRDSNGNGRFRRVTADDWERLQSVHESHAADRTLAIRRDETWWRQKVFDEDDPPYAYAYERDGEFAAYLVYSFADSGEGWADRRLDVADLAFVDHDAYVAVLGFLADHDSQVETVALQREAETSLLDVAPDPAAVECEIRPGPMVRVVDVEHALSTVSYPEDVAVDLSLAVTDDTAHWNDGVFELTVVDGEGDCTRREQASTDPSADATVDVGTLSQLVVGYHAVEEARRVAGLSVERESVADALATAFPPETVYMRQFF